MAAKTLMEDPTNPDRDRKAAEGEVGDGIITDRVREDAPDGGAEIRTWERIDVTPRKCFLTTKGDGPAWDQVVRRETFDLITNKLILSEEVTDKNRGDNRRWHLPLPEPNPRATRTVLHYKHYAVPPPAVEKPKAPSPPGGELSPWNGVQSQRRALRTRRSWVVVPCRRAW